VSKRFELPRGLLNGLKNLSDPKAQVEGLDKALTSLGISQAVLEGQANTTAVSFDKLKGAASDAEATIGQFLAVLLKPAADTGTQVFTKVAEGIKSISEKSGNISKISGAFFAASPSVDAFNKKVEGANKQINDLGIISAIPGIGALANGLNSIGGSFQALNDDQFAFAQSLVKTGVSAESAVSQAQALTKAFDGTNNILSTLPAGLQLSKEQLDNFAVATGNAATAGKDGASVAEGYAIAVKAGAITIEQATALLEAYTAAQAKSAQANTVQAETTQFVSQTTDLFADSLKGSTSRSA